MAREPQLAGLGNILLMLKILHDLTILAYCSSQGVLFLVLGVMQI